MTVTTRSQSHALANGDTKSESIADDRLASRAIRRLIYATLAMCILPLSVMFIVRRVLEVYFHYTYDIAMHYAAIAAIITVCMIVVWFVRLALHEEFDDQQTETDKKKQRTFNSMTDTNNMESFMPNFRDAQVTGAIKRLVVYSAAIILIPLGSMFFSKKMIFQDLMHYNASDANLYAAIIAVIEVHVILCFFVYAAWKEEFRTAPPPPPVMPEKQD